MTLTKGICHLILCARGIDRSQDLPATVASLDRLSGDDGIVIIRAADKSPAHVPVAPLRKALEEAKFTVREDNLARRVGPDVARRYGLAMNETILECAPIRPEAQTRAPRGHDHSHG